MISLHCRRRWFIFRATRVFLFMLLINFHFGTYNHISADTDFDDLNQTVSSKITKQNALNNPEHSYDENSRQVGAYYHRSNAKFRIGIEEEEAMVFESLCFSASSALSMRCSALFLVSAIMCSLPELSKQPWCLHLRRKQHASGRPL